MRGSVRWVWRFVSQPIYRELLTLHEGRSLREVFDANIERAGLHGWVQVHQGTAAAVARTWNKDQTDLLFLDGDHSREAARCAFTAWEPFVKQGGIIAIYNSADRTYAPDRDGSRILALEELRPPKFADVRLVRATDFACKVQ